MKLRKLYFNRFFVSSTLSFFLPSFLFFWLFVLLFSTDRLSKSALFPLLFDFTLFYFFPINLSVSCSNKLLMWSLIEDQLEFFCKVFPVLWSDEYFLHMVQDIEWIINLNCNDYNSHRSLRLRLFPK